MLFRVSLLTIVCFFLFFSAHTQEPLPDVLQRGYISQWMICGPFPSDLEKGIKNAIDKNEAPLGNRDFWIGKGGITQLLPQAGEKIQIDGITYTWLPFVVKNPRLDFHSLQPPDECIYYLSAYVQVPEDQIIYIHLQTPLGARLWISKTKIRDVKAMPIEHLGIDHALVRLRKGLNLFVLQVPFLSLQSISEITKIPVDNIPMKLWSQKEPNIGQTGYEMNFHIRPIEPAGAIYYVPLLEPSRKFTGPEIDPKQVFYLTIYNPTAKQIYPVSINAWIMPQNFSLPNQQLSLQPQEEKRVPLQIPNKGRKQNDKANVRVLITAPNENGENQTSEFNTQITFTEPEPLSKTYLITGTWGEGSSQSGTLHNFLQKTEASKTQIWNAYETQDYGTDIGTGSIWLHVLYQNPDIITPLRETIQRGKSTAQNIFTPIDERLLSTESIFMNYFLGTKLKEGMLKEFNKSFIAWNYPALSPQSSQIIRKCNFNGIVSNISSQTIPSLAFWREPSGNSIMLRTLMTPPAFRNFHEVKKWAFISHAEVEPLIPEIDMLVLENTSPYLNINLLPDLKNEIPPFYFHGNGSSEFFEEILNFLNSRGNIDAIPNIFQPVYVRENLVDILSNLLLKTCLYQLEENLLQAQTSATIAGVFGMSYPGEIIARLWTILLQTADPQIINNELSESEMTSLLSQICTGIHDTEKIIQRTMKHIADNVNTLTYVTDKKPNSQTIVVFNPNSSVKTLPITADIVIPNPQFSLVSTDGKSVSCQIYATQEETSSITTYKVQFVAEEVPPYGIKTFYLIPDTRTTPIVKVKDNFIENEFMLVRINNKTGNITHIIDKTSGKDIIPPESNFDRIGFSDPDKGNFIPFSDVLTRYETFKSDLLQRIVIQFESEKGTLTKEYCLYKNVNQIYCYHCLIPAEGISENSLVSAFNTASDGTVPIYGSQSFALTSPPSISNTKNNNSLFFAHRFFAEGAGDCIKTEDNAYIPLSDIVIIKSDEKIIPVLQNLIMKTLWNRGIPSTTVSIQDWTKKEKNASFYIWTGTAKSYENIKDWIAGTYPKLNDEIIKRSDVGTPFLIRTQRDNSIYNFLGFVANSPEKLGSVIGNFLNMLDQRGEFIIPSAVTIGAGTEIPNYGLAIMFNGTKLVSTNPNKSFYLYHGNINAKEYSPKINAMPIFYRIYPFSGHWLRTDIIKQSNERPLLSTTTGLHGGSWTNNTTFLSLDNPNIYISSIKPMGTGIPLIQSEQQNPTDMFIARLNAIGNQKQECLLSSSFAINSIQALTPLESIDTSSNNLKEQPIHFNPWDIRTLSVSLKKVTAPNRVPFDTKDICYSNSDYITFPLQNGFESPIIKISPVNTSSSANIQLTISNINANETLQGTVFLEASDNCIIKTSQVPYHLTPLTGIQHTIPYEQSEKENSPPIINAWTEINGNTIRTFLSKDEFPAKITYEKTTSQIKITIENTQPVPLYGNITWISLRYSQVAHDILYNQFVKPENTDLYLKPFETNSYTFLPQTISLSDTAIARIQINNKVQFLSIQ
ncbi:MAG: hypothetical protein ACP5KS_00465 [Candidatus Hydrogenedens sp.]